MRRSAKETAVVDGKALPVCAACGQADAQIHITLETNMQVAVCANPAYCRQYAQARGLWCRYDREVIPA